MGVVYIGDRDTGKTHLAMELANPKNEYVKVSSPDYEYLRSFLYDESMGRTKPTNADKEVEVRYLELQIQLPRGSPQIVIDWIDTPGEVWRKQWKRNNPDKWENFLKTVRDSEGILLVLSPYREIIKPNLADPDLFMTKQQWSNRFERWLEFFRQDCPKARHIVICLNKADLFCELEQEAVKLRYKPHRSAMNWQQRHAYVSQRYFRPLHAHLEKLNRSISGLSVNCFITSIYNRHLLELPWIYLGSYLAN